MRLQRFLAQAGLSSRRGATSLLQTGRVAVNGKVALEPGIAVDPRQDRITVDGRPVAAQAAVYVVLHKPPGTICSTRDPEGRETVLDLVRVPGARLYPVGRLDYLTSGVLLLTNDGDLAQALLHPRHGVERTYHVKVHGLLDDEEVQQLAAGVVLDDGQRAQAKVARLASTGRNLWLEMTLTQGLNHQIHRMLEAIGRRVLRIIRVEFAGIRADGLPAGKWRELTEEELAELRRLAGAARPTTRPRTSAARAVGGRRAPGARAASGRARR